MAKRANVTAIFNNKGGILKSSLVSNLAALYAQQGKKVLIIDMDTQANISQIFGLDADKFKPNNYQVLVEGEHPKRAIVNVFDEMKKEHGEIIEVPTVLKSVDILPSNDDMVMFEFAVLMNKAFHDNYFELVRGAVRELQSIYDYILIDSPPNMGIYAGNILTAADNVLIPFHPETLAKRSLKKTLQAVEKFRVAYNPRLEVIGIAPTKVKLNTKQHKKNLKEAYDYAESKGIRMFKSYIPETVKGADAVDEECVPAVLSNIKFSKEMKGLKNAYNGLFEEILVVEKEGAKVHG
ncbi:ParA family protein [Priestia aryabhattai]|uniref:ParA family protein n=1 Tax=Priestia aryabhattai TaxID=412384 RepID=UPI001C8E533C|nr:ParA family protein [Priestia aryabhattai]MBY0077946.1 ParA family protein [Priestia aryabhattai]